MPEVSAGLAAIDWLWIVSFFAISLLIGLVVSRRSGSSASEFFLSGRSMPWWLIGVSMVATTFSTDTPNLVTDIVRQNGVAGNWVWWAFLLTGMLTVFVYARLWRRTGMTTDLEFYELRYSGKSAAFLRGFRALYLGVFFNVVIMASVSIAAVKIGTVMFGFSPAATLLIAGSITVAYSMMGGLTGVIWTDFFQFGIAMFGSIAAAVLALGHEKVGGLAGLLAHGEIAPKLAMVPDPSNTGLFVTLFLIPVAVQWWSTWYPGAEPGGGGYVAQRMLAAKDEKHAVGAVLFFQFAHYALRPWPWIIVALCSLVVYPNLTDLAAAFPHADAKFLQHDMAYSAMLKTVLPPGLLGLVVASLIAAYMSTISTHLNWGSSYIVNDWFKRFVDPRASESTLVMIGRGSTVGLMVLACIVALRLQNALGAFQLMLQIGAGTGLLFILRWFWWRINAWSEIVAMVVSFAVALFMHFAPKMGVQFVADMQDWHRLCAGVAITTIAWVAATLLTKPTDEGTLRNFVRVANPGGPGWSRFSGVSSSAGWAMPWGIVCMMLGCALVWLLLFATGNLIYGNVGLAAAQAAGGVAAGVAIVPAFKRLAACGTG